MFEHHGIIEYPRINALYGIGDITSQVLLALQETGPEEVLDTPLQLFVKCGHFSHKPFIQMGDPGKVTASVALASSPQLSVLVSNVSFHSQ